MARILVLDGHSAAALAVTRSAGQCGHWVAVGGNRGLFAATKLSRYCKLGFDYPISTDDPGAFVDALVEFVRAHSIDLILPITDWTLGPISVQRERFAGLCHIAMPSPRALDTVSDKYRTIKLAESLGIGIPRTHLVESLGDRSQWEENQFPVVVKDRFSVRWSNDASPTKKAVFGSVAYAYSAPELASDFPVLSPAEKRSCLSSGKESGKSIREDRRAAPENPSLWIHLSFRSACG